MNEGEIAVMAMQFRAVRTGAARAGPSRYRRFLTRLLAQFQRAVTRRTFHPVTTSRGGEPLDRGHQSMLL